METDFLFLLGKTKFSGFGTLIAVGEVMNQLHINKKKEKNDV